MSKESPESPDEADALPKATVPVELPAAPAAPEAQPGPSGVPEAIEMGEPADLPPEEAQPPQPTAPKEAEAKTGFGGWLSQLSLAEKLSCGAIVAGIIAFALVVFLPALFDFPDEPPMMDSSDFPIKGMQVELLSAETYWREPELEGEDADAVSPGTVVMPVLDAKVTGRGEVRVLFRDGEDELVGDPLSFAPEGDLDLFAVCTVGFLQRADFVMYQAEAVDPWTVEVHEVPEGAEGVNEQTLLLRMQVSNTLK